MAIRREMTTARQHSDQKLPTETSWFVFDGRILLAVSSMYYDMTFFELDPKTGTLSLLNQISNKGLNFAKAQWLPVGDQIHMVIGSTDKKIYHIELFNKMQRKQGAH